MKNNLTLLIAIILLFTACGKQLDLQPSNDLEKSKKSMQTAALSVPEITKFVFTKADNPLLSRDLVGYIVGNEIRVIYYQNNIPLDNLIPTITCTPGSILTPGNKEAANFTKPVDYTLVGPTGIVAVNTYTVKVERGKDVYILGYEKTSAGKNTKRVVYWKNGNKVVLSDGTEDIWPKGIVVNGNDVYVAASAYDINSSNGRAIYWKNGVRYQLTDITSNVAGITISGSDIYIVGKVYYDGIVYWKNGVKTVVDPMLNGIEATSINVVGNDVYVSGNYYTTSTVTAVYWKNGTKTLLSNIPGSRGVTNTISAVNNDVYVFGEYREPDSTYNFVYWKNAIKTNYAPNTIQFHIFNHIAVGNDIYSAGVYQGSKHYATYWKNGMAIPLVSEADYQFNTKGKFIDIINNNIYVAGEEGNTLATIKPVCWINGQMYRINTANSFVTGMFVKK